MYKLKKLPPKFWKSPDCCQMSIKERIAARRYLSSCFNKKVHTYYWLSFAALMAVTPRATGLPRFLLIAGLCYSSFSYFKTSPLFSYGKHQALNMLNYHLQISQKQREHSQDMETFRHRNASQIRRFNDQFGGAMSPADVLNWYVKHGRNANVI